VRAPENNQDVLCGFFGKHEYNVDAQRRFAVPKAWRHGDPERDQFVLMPAPFKTLQLMPLPTFQEVLQKMRKKISLANAKDFITFGSIGSKTEKVVCDRQGRIALPPAHMAEAGITDRVVLVGAWERIQVWAPAAWEAAQMPSDEWLRAFEDIENRPDDFAEAIRKAVRE